MYLAHVRACDDLADLSYRNYFEGVDMAMNTQTWNLLAVPVISRSSGKDGGKVIAVSRICAPTARSKSPRTCLVSGCITTMVNAQHMVTRFWLFFGGKQPYITSILVESD